MDRDEVSKAREANANVLETDWWKKQMETDSTVWGEAFKKASPCSPRAANANFQYPQKSGRTFS